MSWFLWVRYTHILGPLIASLFIGSVQSRWNEHGLCNVKPVSIWEPFCNEEVLYQPYVRVFHKGRNGALLRDRGPGFIDLSGLKDIYVCTNGLVMLYYEKTTAMGEVYERGELHWSAHTCELYNPSSNNGMKADFPKKCLLSVLLIGHPQDYRLPAMQMFVAPLYDSKYGSYVNATSLIMIGEDGECLIEKGAERARLRVRNVRPPDINEADGKIASTTTTAAPNGPTAPSRLPEPEQAPIFCQLDVQRKLGQYKNIITLAQPDLAEPVTIAYPYRKKVEEITTPAPGPTPPPGIPPQEPNPPKYDPFRGTPYVAGGTGVGGRQTGSGVYPRYSPLEKLVETFGFQEVSSKVELMHMGEIADDVYAGLLADRKMRFIGCLRYPYFSSEQLDIIYMKNDSLPLRVDDKVEESLLFLNYTVAADKGPAFWQEEILKLPWPPEDPANPPTTKEKRVTVYEMSAEPTKTYQELIVGVLEAEKATADAKVYTQFTNLTEQELKDKKKEYNTALSKSTKSRVMISLWPYQKAYFMMKDQAITICNLASNLWAELYKAVTEDDPKGGKHVTKAPTIPTTDNTGKLEDIDYAKMKPLQLAATRKLIVEKLSLAMYDRRFQPYNPTLVKEHEFLEKEYLKVDKLLKKMSVEYGPAISKIETVHSRCKLYKDMFIKSYQELEGAVKYVERGQSPAPTYRGGDPYQKSFMDTIIEITDALKLPELKDVYYTPKDEDYEAAKACRELPAPRATCNAIKPTSIRAGQMLKNRRGKGVDFQADDEWRDKIFDLMEKIFVKVCPYINEEFATAVNRLVKGYLMGEPAGTGLENPVNGSMLDVYNHHYQGIIYNQTYQHINPSNFTKPASTHKDWVPKPKLNAKQEFWDYIIQALEHCEEHAVAMQFWHNEDGDKPAYVTFRKFFHNNNTEVHYDVDDLIMQEKADQEFAFNWVIDMNWRIFATVLGVCMPRYEFKIPLISARFYALYSQDFLSPLRQIWMSNRDNPILKLIMGNFNGACKGDKWAKICMECAFVESGDRSYRPPRYLYVNAFTEMNYFTTGPMAGTSGMLSSVGNR